MPKPILLIDDDDLVLQSLGMLLETQGYATERARNGFEAVEKVRTQEFCIIISDMRMPGMNGIELIKKIREINAELRRKPVPEVLITAYADESAYLQALKLNVTAYLHKPFDMTEFLDIVSKRVGGDGPGG